MMNRISDKPANSGRQEFLDLVKAILIVAMLNNHLIIYGTENYSVSHPVFSFISCVVFSEIFGAQIFMFCMGIGMAYSRNGASPKRLSGRGVKLYAKAWWLNIVRGGALCFFLWLVSGDSAWFNGFLHAATVIDILHFAGLAFLLTALLVKIGLNDLSILAVGVVLSLAGSFIREIQIDSLLLNIILGQFVGTFGGVFDTGFPLFNWFIYVAGGLVFGSRLKRCTDVNRLLLSLFVPSVIIMAVYCAAALPGMTGIFASDNAFYFMTLLDAVFLTAAVFVMFYICYLIMLRLPAGLKKICGFISRNINRIYCAHWIIVLNLFGIILRRILGITLDLPVHIICLIAILLISCYAAYLMERKAERKTEPAQDAGMPGHRPKRTDL